jgi:membrane protease subunit HflK
MYIDTMQQVYSNATKILIDSKQGSNLLYLPLDKIMQMSSQPAPMALEAPQGSAPAAASGIAQPPSIAEGRTRDATRSRDRDSR